jgi:hypothetical protein
MKIKYIIFMIAGLFLIACSPDSYNMGEKDVTTDDLAEGIAYSVTPDPSNPNIIHLKSNMQGYTCLWNHPQGRSQKPTVDLRLPFAGEYEVSFGVETRGGVVYGAPHRFTVSTVCTDFIQDEMWTFLSGGVGESKTWVLDLDASGTCRYFAGPLFFYGVDDSWATVTEGQTVTGDSWSWAADWKGNGSWLFGSTGAADFGSMTFDLKDGANAVVEHLVLGKTEKGTYMLDTENHTLRLTDAEILHDPGRSSIVTQWGNIKVLALTKDYMQLGVLRDNDPSEGPCQLSYNFVSKDYADNWTPGEQAAPEPTLPDGWQDDVSRTVITSIKWVFSEENPVDWCNLNGSRMNGWNTPSDYPDWLGTPDPAVFGGFSMTLDSEDNSAVFVTSDGTTSTCSYTLNEKGIYTFDGAVPSQTVVGGVSFAADFNNQLRLMSIEKDELGVVSGIWLGARAADKDEYTAYHFVPQAGSSSSDDDPYNAWKKGLIGKTFAPDVNYFADWVALDWTGGWTGQDSALFTTPDFTSQSWFWSEDVYNACLASSITFYLEGDNFKADAVDNGVEKKGIDVTIDLENQTLTYSEAPFTFSWIFSNNDDGKGPWLFGARDGSNLGNTDAKGIYFGFISGDNEITMHHLMLK